MTTVIITCTNVTLSLLSIIYGVYTDCKFSPDITDRQHLPTDTDDDDRKALRLHLIMCLFIKLMSYVGTIIATLCHMFFGNPDL